MLPVAQEMKFAMTPPLTARRPWAVCESAQSRFDNLADIIPSEGRKGSTDGEEREKKDETNDDSYSSFRVSFLAPLRAKLNIRWMALQQRYFILSCSKQPSVVVVVL